MTSNKRIGFTKEAIEILKLAEDEEQAGWFLNGWSACSDAICNKDTKYLSPEEDERWQKFAIGIMDNMINNAKRKL